MTYSFKFAIINIEVFIKFLSPLNKSKGKQDIKCLEKKTMNEKKSIKEYTKDEIEKIDDPIELYNLLLRPAQKMKERIESSEKINDAFVAVYGASTYPLLRRINALNKLSNYVNLDNGILFSGSRSWTTIVPSSYTFRPSLFEIKDYMKSQGKNITQYTKTEIEEIENLIKIEKINEYVQQNQEKISTRAHDILKEFPTLKKQLYDMEKGKWESLLNNYQKEYAESSDSEQKKKRLSVPNFKSYDEMYSDFLNKKIEDVKKSDDDLKSFYEIYKAEKEKNLEQTADFDEWHNQYKMNNNSGQQFFQWLEAHFDSQHFENLIVHNVTEVDLMNIEWKKLSEEQIFSKIVEDTKATNSAENAINTIEEFQKLREQNPNLKKLIVISEWQYLLRQVLTTKKIAKDKGLEDIEIIGYPADMDYTNGIALKTTDINKYRNIMKTDLIKIATYNDVADFPIDETSKKASLDSNSPKIFIGNTTLEEYSKNQKSFPNSQSDTDYR